METKKRLTFEEKTSRVLSSMVADKTGAKFSLDQLRDRIRRELHVFNRRTISDLVRAFEACEYNRHLEEPGYFQVKDMPGEAGK